MNAISAIGEMNEEKLSSRVHFIANVDSKLIKIFNLIDNTICRDFEMHNLHQLQEFD